MEVISVRENMDGISNVIQMSEFSFTHHGKPKDLSEYVPTIGENFIRTICKLEPHVAEHAKSSMDNNMMGLKLFLSFISANPSLALSQSLLAGEEKFGTRYQWELALMAFHHNVDKRPLGSSGKNKYVSAVNYWLNLLSTHGFCPDVKLSMFAKSQYAPRKKPSTLVDHPTPQSPDDEFEELVEDANLEKPDFDEAAEIYRNLAVEASLLSEQGASTLKGMTYAQQIEYVLERRLLAIRNFAQAEFEECVKRRDYGKKCISTYRIDAETFNEYLNWSRKLYGGAKNPLLDWVIDLSYDEFRGILIAWCHLFNQGLPIKEKVDQEKYTKLSREVRRRRTCSSCMELPAKDRKLDKCPTCLTPDEFHIRDCWLTEHLGCGEKLIASAVTLISFDVLANYQDVAFIKHDCLDLECSEFPVIEWEKKRAK